MPSKRSRWHLPGTSELLIAQGRRMGILARAGAATVLRAADESFGIGAAFAILQLLSCHLHLRIRSRFALMGGEERVPLVSSYKPRHLPPEDSSKQVHIRH